MRVNWRILDGDGGTRDEQVVVIHMTLHELREGLEGTEGSPHGLGVDRAGAASAGYVKPVRLVYAQGQFGVRVLHGDIDGGQRFCLRGGGTNGGCGVGYLRRGPFLVPDQVGVAFDGRLELWDSGAMDLKGFL